MRTTALIGIGYALFASGALAECFSNGSQDFGGDKGKDRVTQLIASQCMNGPLGNTHYEGHKTHSTCIRLDDNISVDFRVENRQGKRVFFNTADCTNYLLKEVSGCDHGGETKHSDWKIKVDPNQGQCTP